MRGFWHLVDAVLACIIILGFLIIIGQNVVFAPQPENLNILAFEKLKDLDEQGILREYAVNKNHTGLNSEVILYIYNHSIQICDYSGSCAGERPEDKNVWVGTYMMSGKGYYSPHTVKLYIW